MRHGNPNPPYLTVAIIAGAMLATLGLYAALAAVVRSSPAPEPPPVLATLRIVFEGVAAAVAIFIWLLRRLLLGPARRPEFPAHRFLVTTVITGGLAELPAIFGLVLFFMSRSDSDFYPLLALSVALMVLWFPTPGRMRRYVGEPTGAA